MSIGVVIPAAGQGKRMKSKVNKLFLKLQGIPILAHTISLFVDHSDIGQIVVVTREDEMNFCQTDVINRYFSENIKVIAGGKSRRQSVFYGLQAFSPTIDYVIIHDGARPLLPKFLVDRVISTVKEHNAITLGIRLKNTVKKVDKNGYIKTTPPRNSLSSIQTPQAFSYDLITKAHRQVSYQLPITDDASLVENIGYPVKVIEGSDDNIKITTQFDLLISRVILKNRKEALTR